MLVEHALFSLTHSRRRTTSWGFLRLTNTLGHWKHNHNTTEKEKNSNKSVKKVKL